MPEMLRFRINVNPSSGRNTESTKSSQPSQPKVYIPKLDRTRYDTRLVNTHTHTHAHTYASQARI